MSLKRTATIVLAGGALLAWLAGAATSIHPAPQPPAFQPAPIDTRGADLASEIAKLRERLRPTATPRQPARNLFTFRAAAIRPPAPAALPPPPEPIEPPTIRPSEPPLKLAGIAEDAGPDGPVRTAFIKSDPQLFIVKEGETVAQRYTVTKIAADAVELTAIADGSVRRLALR